MENNLNNSNSLNNLNNKIYIYPTDTVWGVGASIYSKVAHEKILRVKQVDAIKPTSILFSDIEMIRDYFSFPLELNDRFLEFFFSLESTLAVTNKLCNRPIPEWITCNSPLVAIRYLKSSCLKKIIKNTDAPITTTSLNISKQSPITDIKDALMFKEKYLKEAYLVEDRNCTLSGESSSILSYGLDGKIEFLRRGRFANEIEKHIRLLSA